MTSRRWFGQATTFRDAFPQVKSLRLEVHQEGASPGVHCRDDVFTEADIVPTVQCANHLCQRGGYEVEQQLRFAVEAREDAVEWEWICEGHEGSRVGLPCDTFAKLKLSITYRED